MIHSIGNGIGNGNGIGKKHVNKKCEMKLKNNIQQLPYELQHIILDYTDYYTFNFFKKHIDQFIYNQTIIYTYTKYDQFIYYLKLINNNHIINNIKLSYIYENILRIIFICIHQDKKLFHYSYSKLFYNLIYKNHEIKNKLYFNHLNNYYSIISIQYEKFLTNLAVFRNWREKLDLKINNVYNETKKYFDILKNIYSLLYFESNLKDIQNI